MRRILALAAKDLRLLLRDKLGLFWIVAFPLLMATFIASVVGGEGGRGNMKVGVADLDGAEFSRLYAAKLAKNPAILLAASGDIEASLAIQRDWKAEAARLREELADEPAKLSEALAKILKKRDERLAKLEPLTLEQAREAVRKGDLTAYIALNPGFSDSLGLFPVEGGGSAMEIGADPSRQAEAGILQGVAAQAIFEALQARYLNIQSARDAVADFKRQLEEDDGGFLTEASKKLLGDSLDNLGEFLAQPSVDALGAGGGDGGSPGGFGLSIATADMARDQTGQPRSAYDVTFPSAILWGVVGCVATFAVSLVVERTRGTYQRLRLSPMSGAEILAGKGLACFVACAVDVMLLVAIGVFAFGMRAGSWPGLVLAAACTGFCFVGAMMFVAVLGKTEASVAGAGWALFIVWMMFGGGMIPLIAMPPWMETASDFSPVKWAIYAIEGAVWRDLTFAELLKPCGILVGVGVALFLLGLALFRRGDS